MTFIRYPSTLHFYGCNFHISIISLELLKEIGSSVMFFCLDTPFNLIRLLLRFVTQS